jgi:hypothetical protein
MNSSLTSNEHGAWKMESMIHVEQVVVRHGRRRWDHGARHVSMRSDFLIVDGFTGPALTRHEPNDQRLGSRMT